MTMTIQGQRSAEHDDDVITELTPEEWRAGAQRALAELGLTYVELADQARRRAFTSAQAHALWTAIGGTLDQ
ncbi:hypothetical protein [Streptomyces sp. NPDC002845]